MHVYLICPFFSQFLSSKPENVEFESQLADKSQKSNTDYRGLLKLNSTAYPNFNFASSLIFLSSQGHVDCTLALNNAPDLLVSLFNKWLFFINLKS